MASVAPSIAEEISMPREAVGAAARAVAVAVERDTGCVVLSPAGTVAGAAGSVGAALEVFGSPTISRDAFVAIARDSAGLVAEICRGAGGVLRRAFFGRVASLPGATSTDGFTGVAATEVAARIPEFGFARAD